MRVDKANYLQVMTNLFPGPLQIYCLVGGVVAALYPVVYLPFQKAKGGDVIAPAEAGFSKKGMWNTIDTQVKSPDGERPNP